MTEVTYNKLCLFFLVGVQLVDRPSLMSLMYTRKSRGPSTDIDHIDYVNGIGNRSREQ